MNRTAAIGTCAWPAHLRPGALRWARSSAHYAATVAFYRDAVGLPVVGEFTASFGEDGTIFGLPDTGIQMEIVRAHPASAGPDGFDQLVLYLNDMEAVTTATAPLRKQGFTPDPAPHGYWAANGAVVFRDPDGRGVVFAPWVYGRDADPVDGGSEITDAGTDGEPRCTSTGTTATAPRCVRCSRRPKTPERSWTATSTRAAFLSPGAAPMRSAICSSSRRMTLSS